jgi:hypothetical protein
LLIIRASFARYLIVNARYGGGRLAHRVYLGPPERRSAGPAIPERSHAAGIVFVLHWFVATGWLLIDWQS